MLYTLEQGPTEQLIIKQCVQQRLPLPARIANAPQLEGSLQFFMQAFFDLTTCRNANYGTEGPIPWTSILLWSQHHEVGKEQTEDLFYQLAKMDSVYLAFKTKKLQAQ